MGATVNLGKLDTVNQISRLVGSTDNPMLRMDNNSAGHNATALDLKVESGHPPMRVNSSTQVAGLNADQLDGRNASEFVTTNNTYTLGSGQEQLGTLLGDGTSVKTNAATVGTGCSRGDRPAWSPGPRS